MNQKEIAIKSYLFCFFVFISTNSIAEELDGSIFFERLFLGARVEDGLIHFKSPYDIDWVAHAPPEFKNIDEKNPSKKDLDRLIAARGLFDISELRFEADLPSDTNHFLHCNFISPHGINELVAPRLSGSVNFFVFKEAGDSEYKIGEKSFGGGFVARSKRVINSNEGGFVLCSKKPLKFELSYSELTKSDLKKYLLSDSYFAKVFEKNKDPIYWKVDKKYTFKIEGQGIWYRFIQFAADNLCHHGCCGKRYVVTKRDSYNLLEKKSYECDI